MLTSRVIIRNGMVKDTWKEEDHPRSKSGPTAGQFIKKGTSSVGSVKEKKTKLVPKAYRMFTTAEQVLKAHREEKEALKEADLREIDLEDCDLEGIDLTSANLSKASMKYVKMGGSRLSKANFSGADLYRVRLWKADLTKANLINANLKECNLFDVNLTGANLKEANLKRTSLRRANLKNANLTGADLTGTNITLRQLLQASKLFGAKLPKELNITPEQIFSLKEETRNLVKKLDLPFERDMFGEEHEIDEEEELDEGEELTVQKLKHQVVKDLSKKTKLAYDQVNKEIKLWATTSADSHEYAIATQLIAKKIFHLDDAKIDHMEEKAELKFNKAKNIIDNDHDEKVKKIKLLEAQYETTQRYLATRGIKELVLFRGVGDSYNPEKDKQVALQPLSSCSLEEEVAYTFGDNVMALRVPREKIFSLPLTGIGCAVETEVVVFGGVYAPLE